MFIRRFEDGGDVSNLRIFLSLKLAIDISRIVEAPIEDIFVFE